MVEKKKIGKKIRKRKIYFRESEGEKKEEKEKGSVEVAKK